MKKKEYIKRRIIAGSIILVFFLFLGLLIIYNIPKKEKEFKITKMNYKYESRVEKLNNFNTDGLKKYGWLQVQGTNVDAIVLTSLSRVDA